MTAATTRLTITPTRRFAATSPLKGEVEANTRPETNP